MGDFNCNMLPASFYNTNNQALLNITDIYNLKQLITEPTRITPLSSTLIDVILLIFQTILLVLGCLILESAITDWWSSTARFRHLLLSRELALLLIYRQFKNFNRNSFRSDILAQSWDDLKGVHNHNEMWLKWKTLFLEMSDVHAPLRSKRVRSSNSPAELKKMMHFRDRLKIKAIRSGDPNDWNDFKRARNNAVRMLKSPIIWNLWQLVTATHVN